MQSIYLTVMLFFALVFVITTMMIAGYLKKRGEKVQFLWIKLMMISYADQYRRITKQETGKVGVLYYIWIISVNLALLPSGPLAVCGPEGARGPQEHSGPTGLNPLLVLLEV